VLYSAFEAGDVVVGAPMKFLQAMRTPAKVKDAASMLGADDMSDWFFGQAYRADFQRFGLSDVTLCICNEEITATGAAKDILDVRVLERERRIRGDPESDE
jgi:hypothetical protein